MPNFTALDMSLPGVATLVAAMVQARLGRRACGPRARKRERRTDPAVKQAFYRLADERREIILVACSKYD